MRTEEEAEADEALASAIKKVIDVYQGDSNYLMSDYMVICVQSRIDEDGEPETAYNYLYSSGSMPSHTILGLLDIARGRIQANANSDRE